MAENFPTSPKSLKQLFRDLDFHPRKSFGQNFLIRESFAHQLVESLGALREATVLEIGGGFGILTGLLAKRSKRVIVFELDRILSDFLRRTLGPSVEVVQDDICNADFSKLAESSGKVKVIGNLPYASSSAILLHLAGQKTWIEGAVLTLQKEVAQRCLASPGSKAYSPLTCAMQYAAKVEKLFLMGPDSFYPKPEVTSCAIKLTFLPKPRVTVSNEEFFFKVIRTAFGKRRKQLINSLAGSLFSKEKVAAALKEAGIDPTQRAEELSLEEFARLAESLLK